jgi:hypothetical protein
MAFVAVVVVAAIGGGLAEGHDGHPQKKLFESRWYHQVQGNNYVSWMDLSTSDHWFECGTDEGDCMSRWGTPVGDAVADWNASDMTVDFVPAGTQDLENNINVFIEDELFGDPTLLGFETDYDINEDECFFSCTIYYQEVYVSDTAHSGPYGTYEERRGTVAHELGHALALRHESVNGDESVQYDCGVDDTGEIPLSIMSYNCIDPGPVGQGIFQVQPWDVCGVNHAYYDPTIGYGDCEGGSEPTPTASPTITPGPGQVFWGDVDCGGGVNPVDSLKLLRTDAGLPVSQPGGCPGMGANVTIGGNPRAWGDLNCNGDVEPVDSLFVLRKDGGLPVNTPSGCPEMGAPVTPGS